MSTADAARVLWVAERIISANPYGFLVTGGAELGVRLVHHLRGGLTELWIGTSPVSRKVAAVRAHRDVAYAIEDRSRFAYLSLHGTASLVDEPSILEREWQPSLEAFFPAGPLGGGFTLIRIEPERLEIMSFADGVHPDPVGLVAAMSRRTAAGWP